MDTIDRQAGGKKVLLRGKKRYILLGLVIMILLFLWLPSRYKGKLHIYPKKQLITTAQSYREHGISKTQNMRLDNWSVKQHHPSCQPVKNFVLIKTRKTGGSTTANILFRYGLMNDLVTVLAPKAHALISVTEENELDILQYNCFDFPGYNFIASHVQYNRAQIEKVIPNAKYFTILRSPYGQFQSAFYWYGFHDYLVSLNSSDPYIDFFKSPERYLETGNVGRRIKSHIKNSQFWMLGLDYEYDDDDEAVANKIQQIESELDLVLLTEYYDESIVLLKKLLCWKDEDVVYYLNKVHDETQENLSPVVKEKVEQWNKADFKLYNHFNETFWQKVKSYDGDFEQDLVTFRKRQKIVTEQCEEINYESEFCYILKSETKDLRKMFLSKQSRFIC
ncbi:galactosylceramide sulfotransferase-like [Glandiceps talaboti]